MNTMTTRALMVGLLIALWAWLADVSRLHLALWAGVVALGCFYAAGGGVPALQKTIVAALSGVVWVLIYHAGQRRHDRLDRKSTRLNSSHITISYAVFCLKKKKKQRKATSR